MAGLVATTEVDINASREEVWEALTDPVRIARYFFGTTVRTDWQPGSAITWSGDYNGQSYEDKGTILEARAPELLVMTHFSPMTGQPDVPESYHTLTYRLRAAGAITHLRLDQDNNASPEEAERSTGNWKTVLDGLKSVVEKGG